MTEKLIRDFWAAMNSNDWAGVAARFLGDDYVAVMPQSGEVLRGAADFIRLNRAFPGQGDWRFEVMSVVADGDRVVSDVRITNPPLDVTARVIAFHDLAGDRIARQTEFWPDPYPVPEWRQGMLATDPDLARF